MVPRHAWGVCPALAPAQKRHAAHESGALPPSGRRELKEWKRSVEVEWATGSRWRYLGCEAVGCCPRDKNGCAYFLCGTSALHLCPYTLLLSPQLIPNYHENALHPDQQHQGQNTHWQTQPYTHTQCKIFIHSQNSPYLLPLFLNFVCVHGCVFVYGKPQLGLMKVKVCGVGRVGDVVVFFFFFVCWILYLTDIWDSWTKPPLWVFVKQRQKEWRTRGNNKTHWKTGEMRGTRER